MPPSMTLHLDPNNALRTVIGPPGSGKSTYCNGMHQFMSAIGRKCSVVNLDPANENISYPCAVDVRDFQTVETIMEEQNLGPNGSMLYALEDLELNIDWLEERLIRLGQDYVLFDCPGQVELFTVHDSIRKIFKRLEKLGYRLTVVNLIDSSYCADASKYISVLLLALRSMLLLEYPHVNILSKIDLIRNYAPLPFPLNFYTDVDDLPQLLPELSASQTSPKFSALNEAIVEMVESFSLVAFEVLAVENKKSMMRVLQAIDRAGGYAFGAAEGAGDSVFAVAMRQGWGEEVDLQERWIDLKEEWDEKEREEEEKAREEARKRGLAMEGLPEDFDEDE